MTHLKKTIVQIVPRLDAGGAERTTLEIAEAVTRAGGRAIVVTEGGRLGAEIEKIGGEIVLAPVASKNPFTIWRNARWLAALIKRENVDLIHARSRAPAWSAYLAKQAISVALVTTYHGAYEESSAIKRLYNSSMLRGDRVIANSQFTADRIMGRTTGVNTVNQDRFAIIPRGVDLALFDSQKVAPSRVEALIGQWKLGENQGLKLLMPARPSLWKGHETALRAVRALKAARPQTGPTGQGSLLTLVFCGGANGKQDFDGRMRGLSEEFGVRDMVHWVGDCADMPAAYAWADIVLAPSTKPEAFGRVAIEAAAMGKPVIAADHGGARETVVDGETGILCAPGDATALAEAIEKVQGMSTTDREAMSTSARVRAAQLYSSEAMCDATLEVYRALLVERV